MYSDKMVAAFNFAAHAHQKQKRKGSKTPYIAHPMAVASLVLEHGGGEDVVCAALLHDTIEDCGTLPDTILVGFGQTVLDLVQAVTNPPIDWKSFKTNEDLQETLKAFRMRNFEKLRTSTPDVLLLSACDKLHNARGLLEDLRKARDEAGRGETPEERMLLVRTVWDRFRGKRDGTIWYYVEMAKVYQASKVPQVVTLSNALAEVCAQMDAKY